MLALSYWLGGGGVSGRFQLGHGVPSTRRVLVRRAVSCGYMVAGEILGVCWDSEICILIPFWYVIA